ncbi:MAG: DUF3306 domain-containing protein [Burkholderiaceae bacterium]|nr:DUF3306 domain-containing protein [Burkholderiaceae bacterium]
MSDREDSGFLSRWARRKAEVRQGLPVDEAPPLPPLPAVAPPAPVAAVAAPEPVLEENPPAPAEPLPTLADVAALGQDASYSRFMASGVDADVKRAALKKLFAEPQFNVMDGLDIYIDDYGKPDPLPPGMLRQMNQSWALGLFGDEEREPSEKRTPDDVDAGTPAVVQAPELSQSDHDAAPAAPGTPPDTQAPTDEDPDLQLQPDDAAGCGGAESQRR